MSSLKKLGDTDSVSYLELLVTGYLSIGAYYDSIPGDVLIVIAKYFIHYQLNNDFYLICISRGAPKPMYHISYENNSPLSQLSARDPFKPTMVQRSSIFSNNMNLISVSSKEAFTCKAIDLSSSVSYSGSQSAVDVASCNIHHRALPHYRCFNKYRNTANPPVLLDDNQWSMVVNIGGYLAAETWRYSQRINECKLIAYHMSSFFDTKSVQAMHVELPPFPEGISSASCIYSDRYKKLLVMNGERDHCNDKTGKAIFALDLSEQPADKQQTADMPASYLEDELVPSEQWQWEIMSKNLKCMREKTSVCLVDDERCLAVMGGISNQTGADCKYAELYMFNCDQSIWLQDMKERKVNAPSAYHADLHKIFVVGPDRVYAQRENKNTVAVYDINKNYWSKHRYPQILCNICNQHQLFRMENDPWILLFSAQRKNKCVVGRIDLRLVGHYKSCELMKVNAMDIYADQYQPFLGGLLTKLTCRK